MSTIDIIQTIGLIIAILFGAKQLIDATKQKKTDTIFKIIDRLETSRADRHIVYKLREKDLKKWTDSDRKAADNVCREFDILGIIHKEILVPKSFLMDFYAVPAARCWNICKQYVYSERVRRSQTHHLKAFEDIGQICIKLRPDSLEYPFLNY